MFANPSKTQLDIVLFYILFALTFASRVLVIAQVISSSASTILIQIVYLLYLCILWLFSLKNGRYLPTAFSLYATLVLIHSLIFCCLAVNPRMPSDLGIGNTVFLYTLIVLFTAWFIRKKSIVRGFTTLCFYVLGIILIVQFLTHIDDFNLSRISSIFIEGERIRAMFGFGHPNTLGGLVVSIFMMELYLCALGNNNRPFIQLLLDFVILLVAMLMLLCSASRSSIVGLIALIVVWGLGTISHKNKYYLPISILLKSIAAVCLIYVAWTIASSMSVDGILGESNRATLFSHAIPELSKSGRSMIGLGYVSNTAYGEGLTPYNTLWLDNSYIYYLVSTGVIGLTLVLLALFVLFAGAFHSVRSDHKLCVYYRAVLLAYLLIGLFEVSVLAPVSMNYFLIPILLSSIKPDFLRRAVRSRHRFGYNRRVEK